MTSIGRHGLPSPIHSTQSPTPSHASSLNRSSSLPAQRHHPLIPGSPKEIALITYVDTKVLYITRRFATKYTNIKTVAKEAPGYTRFEQFIKDLNPLIDLVWATGTPTLQIPYMLTFAGMVASYMSAFPFTTQMFPVLKRLDMTFSSLLTSSDAVVPSRSLVSTTEKVRIKSLIDETRVTAVRHGTSAGHSIDIVEDDEDEDDDDDEDDMDRLTVESSMADGEVDGSIPADSRHIAMALSKVYESTMAILGDDLIMPEPILQQDDSMDTS